MLKGMLTFSCPMKGYTKAGQSNQNPSVVGCQSQKLARFFKYCQEYIIALLLCTLGIVGTRNSFIALCS